MGWFRVYKKVKDIQREQDAQGQVLDLVLQKLEAIMSQQDDALAALKKIDDATTKQAASLQQDADSLQKISDNLDGLVAKLGTTVPADVLAGLQAAAGHVQTVSDAMDAQAAFAKALAGKGAADPVPVGPPAPAPVTP